jgi:probable F420-dependent oxidoreductase
MPWKSPGPHLREYIEAVRAVWQTFQTRERLNYRGAFYKLTYMNPLFQPDPMPFSDIPIYIAGVRAYMCQLAGELCQGFHVHPLHTLDYLRNFTLPNIQRGLEKAGRSRQDIQLTCSIFIVTDETQKAEVKRQIAFYATTPSYRPVLEMQGVGDLQEHLSGLARRGKWHEMGAAISDELLAQFAVIAPPDEIGFAVKERYQGLLDRVSYYFPYTPGEQSLLWRSSLAAFH